jgi:hypothetical protein
MQKIKLDPLIKDRRVQKAEWIPIDTEETQWNMVLTIDAEPMSSTDRLKLLADIGIQDNPSENKWIVHKLPRKSGYWISSTITKKNACMLL